MENIIRGIFGTLMLLVFIGVVILISPIILVVVSIKGGNKFLDWLMTYREEHK